MLGRFIIFLKKGSLSIYYLHQGAYLFTFVQVSVGWLVCRQDYTITTKKDKS